MRVFLTGATGFIGFHSARRLLEAGHDLRALVRDADKGRRILLPLAPAGRVELCFGDMCDRAVVASALHDCGAVLHAAASVSVTQGRTDFEANVRGTENVIGGACERDIPALYVSSLEAISDPGAGGRQPVSGESPIAASTSPYGRSKARAERFVRDRQSAGARVGTVYPSGVVGPDDPGFSESVRAYRSFLRGTLQSSGGNQFVDVRDLALLLATMIERGPQGRIVAAGHFFDWDEFTALLETVTGARIPRIRAPGWALRMAARALDVVGQVTGRTMPITGEGIAIATRWRRIADSPEIGEWGIGWRAPEATLADLFAWFVDAGRLPPGAVPALAQAPA